MNVKLLTDAMTHIIVELLDSDSKLRNSIDSFDQELI